MIPAGCNDYSAFVTEVYVVLGTFNLNGVSNNDTVHLVISLKPGTIATVSGTSNDPYIIQAR